MPVDENTYPSMLAHAYSSQNSKGVRGIHAHLIFSDSSQNDIRQGEYFQFCFEMISTGVTMYLLLVSASDILRAWISEQKLIDIVHVIHIAIVTATATLQKNVTKHHFGVNLPWQKRNVFVSIEYEKTVSLFPWFSLRSMSDQLSSHVCRKEKFFPESLHWTLLGNKTLPAI